MDPQTRELKHRVEAKKNALMAQLEEKKADGVERVSESNKTIRRKLDELEKSLEEGWGHLSTRSMKRVNEWLKSA